MLGRTVTKKTKTTTENKNNHILVKFVSCHVNQQSYIREIIFNITLLKIKKLKSDFNNFSWEDLNVTVFCLVMRKIWKASKAIPA